MEPLLNLLRVLLPNALPLEFNRVLWIRVEQVSGHPGTDGFAAPILIV
jgi:hypothetical protein